MSAKDGAPLGLVAGTEAVPVGGSLAGLVVEDEDAGCAGDVLDELPHLGIVLGFDSALVGVALVAAGGLDLVATELEAIPVEGELVFPAADVGHSHRGGNGGPFVGDGFAEAGQGLVNGDDAISNKAGL